MSQGSETTPLQFDRAEFAQAPPATACTACQKAISSHYYEVNGKVVCSYCRGQLVNAGEQGSSASRFFRALFAGVAAGAVGSLIYFGIAKLTGYEFGLVAVLVGFAVGGAVKWGCYGRGGRGYQVLAVAITYLAIVSTYIPPVLEALKEKSEPVAAAQNVADANAAPAPAAADEEPPTLAGFLLAITALMLIACAAPFLAGLQNIIGLVIIGFGLWEAWKINQRQELSITGPHALAPTTPPPLAGV